MEPQESERWIIGCCNLITAEDGRYLLVREAKQSARERYNLPAGKPEVGELLTEAAVREAHEETGLVVDVDHLVGIYQCAQTSEGFGVVNFVFASHVVGGSLTTSLAHPEVRYFSVTEIHELAADRLLRGTHIPRAIQDHQDGHRMDLDLLQVCDASPFPSAPGLAAPALPRVVCLCGSTRFRDEMLLAARAETLAGRIVVTPWVFSQAEAESLDDEEVDALRELHRRKIDLAHEVLVIDVDGYVGEATSAEIEYAESKGKAVRYWSNEPVVAGRSIVSPTAALIEAHRAQRIVTNHVPTLDVSDAVKELRCALIDEEAAELRAAIEADDIVEVADALGDLLTVVYGAALTFGIPIAEVFTEIHRSNMTKLDDDGQPILRADGKVLKGPNFSPPELLSILERHGYQRTAT